ncbi:Insulinase (Peptidase family M16) [Rugamonas rubra]|uniref:Insulinase (Peptidase family M16) n=2 Tax=Rugamonas rubra TaxID=758825 RepID=A0A1I4R3U8_9BURK|nr:Insulinase (Peptidase family M16) [Rugamonas rubra]
MFRGTRDYPPGKYQAVITKAGARQNAHTSDDLTNYHTTFAKQDLEAVLKVEADRVQHPSYGEDAFKTEARAVLGEYNKNSANPQSTLFEAMRDAAFGRTSPRYKRLVQDEQKVDQLYDYTPGRVDPTLATIGARVKKIDDAVYVRDAILRTVAQLRSSPVGAQNLADAKSALKYGPIRSLDNTGQIAISFGLPLSVPRRHPDFPALWLAKTWLGEHRASSAHLYQRMRELRGMSYGDYAYIEAFAE